MPNDIPLEKEEKKSDLGFIVVGIGASAGGLEAIKSLLSSVPENSGMAYVFVQHLSPHVPSALPEILGRTSKIPVVDISDDIKLEKDHFYIIPSNKMLTMVDGKLKLDDRGEKNKGIKVIDLFFSSLGVVHQTNAVGVVLSGTLDDGSLGLKVIKSNGGITFVQDDSAAFDGMPQNAIKTGAADFVLPPEKIIPRLIEINHISDNLDKNSSVTNEDVEIQDELYREILALLRLKYAVDFRSYKQSTVKRRLMRRMALTKHEMPADYYNFLKEHKTEQDLLFNDMLINVTEFFRDGPTFDVLCNNIFPDILAHKEKDEALRIWVAGCATGEEAYSVAMCVQDALGDKTTVGKIQIFATDISDAAIAKARTGIYKCEEIKNISPQRLAQYFTKIDGSYQVNKNLREICVFARHNMIKDPPFSKIDVVCCRNVLIYMQPVLQRKVFTIFHYSLRQKGILFLGKSETIGANTELFVPYNKYEKVYRKKGTEGRFMHVASAINEEMLRTDNISTTPVNGFNDIFKKADEILLAKYTPAGVVINENFDIMQFKGDTSPWLAPQPGKASLNLMKMAKEELIFELRHLLHQAKNTLLPVRKNDIVLKVKGIKEYVSIEAMPVPSLVEPFYLVLFKSADRYNDATTTKNRKKDKDSPLQARIDQLEKELAQNREDMRSVTEEQEMSNEELQSINEELLSGSEELQTLNEELETSKEEMQSANEELSSLNHELVDRNEQLNSARVFTEGVFDTIRDPVVLLDGNFKVINATKNFYTKFKIKEHQAEGKLLFELADNQWDLPELRDRLQKINDEIPCFLNFETEQHFSHIGKRTMLLNCRQLQRVDGQKMLMLSIEDITDKRRSEEMMHELQRLNANLQYSNNELEQFAFSASQDMQEPLRKILAFISMLEHKQVEFSTDAKLYLDKIAASARRMSKIIEGLFSYAKLSGIKPFFEPTDLNQVVKNVLNDLEIVIKNTAAVINLEVLPVVSAIPLFMNQLFYNLVNNALKFTKKIGTPTISISASTLTAEEIKKYAELNPTISYVCIKVKDNGIGFDQEYAEKIFNIFNRINARFEFEGLGIGLFLCRKIMMQHNGTIFAESEPDEGATFSVILPLL